MAKTRVKAKAQPKSLADEYIGLASICIFLLIFLYWIYRRSTAASRKYKQTNPYVATVDLQERYGGLEKRAVSISDLSTEQLILLKRDGKLNSTTILKLEREGKLPGNGASYPAAYASYPATHTPTPTPAVVTATAGAGLAVKDPVKQRKGKSAKSKKK